MQQIQVVNFSRGQSKSHYSQQSEDNYQISQFEQNEIYHFENYFSETTQLELLDFLLYSINNGCIKLAEKIIKTKKISYSIYEYYYLDRIIFETICGDYYDFAVFFKQHLLNIGVNMNKFAKIVERFRYLVPPGNKTYSFLVSFIPRNNRNDYRRFKLTGSA